MVGLLLQREHPSPSGVVPPPEKGIECGIPEFLALSEAFGSGVWSFLRCERCHSRFGLWMKRRMGCLAAGIPGPLTPNIGSEALHGTVLAHQVSRRGPEAE